MVEYLGQYLIQKKGKKKSFSSTWPRTYTKIDPSTCPRTWVEKQAS